MTILVLGAAGYIGSHAVHYLISHGESVVAYDNLSAGFSESLKALDIVFVEADIRDTQLLESTIKEHNVDSIIHFAAHIEVGESVQDPIKYYDNNVTGSLSVLRAMRNTGCKHIVFSSTAAIFGNPSITPIPEDAPTIPINPYGQSKLMVEQLLKSVCGIHDMTYVALRYFNASGAHPFASIGESHSPETHLVPLVLQVALGQRPHIKMFGSDYNTRDGTCVRDYIHVMDLASAHYKALLYLREGNPSNYFNLGSGVGYSVKEVIEAARKVTGCEIPCVEAPRRAGDPDTLIADSKKAEEILGWKRDHSELEEIISTAWRWHKEHPNGFNS
ncbi:hypothetical protein GEMRC1_001936 [Eukaryota sp. GEM-RC1]